MSKFSDWLEAKEGRSAELARHMGYARSFVSNIKAGRKRMPPHWFPHVIAFANGELSYADIVPQQPLGSKRRV